MLTVVEGILLCFATSESLLGVLGNGFILHETCIDQVRQKKCSKIGFILAGLAISRICVIGVLISDGYLKLLSPHMVASDAHITGVAYLWTIFSHISTWFATSLNLFYLLKIANFSHYTFLCLKRRINTMFTLLLGCLFISWSISFPQIMKMVNDKLQHRNTSWEFHFLKSEFIINHILLNLGIFFFFMMTIIIYFLLIISLWRHNRQMKLNVLGLNNLNTGVHVKAIKVLISFLILFISHFIGVFIEMLSFYISQNKLMLIIGLTIACMYPCCHSFILILANSQLKHASLRALKQLKCYEKGKGSGQHGRLSEK
ncbi:taste receptor type 2 member 106-like [Onychomys torridus]|uniref:taste receptor type 2 member 106-like n=1 Tax=Onychomys torridus TaxID=38674 RepID=UPI00167FB798|nr:taste receptor type 2 member 106-like [Onychomys torridus]